jgi:hypothetical protein
LINSLTFSYFSTFDEGQLTDQILANVKRANYTKPTPIQRVAIPIITAGFSSSRLVKFYIQFFNPAQSINCWLFSIFVKLYV